MEKIAKAPLIRDRCQRHLIRRKKNSAYAKWLLYRSCFKQFASVEVNFAKGLDDDQGKIHIGTYIGAHWNCLILSLKAQREAEKEKRRGGG